MTSIEQLYQQQHGACYYCKVQMLPLQNSGETLQAYNTPTFDHKILKSNGGTRNVDNGVCACYLCNRLRGNINFTQFREIVYDTTSRNRFRRAKHQAQKSKDTRKEWFKTYRPCTLTSTATPPKTKKPNAHERKHRLWLALLKSTLAEQGGRCKACNTFTLGVLEDSNDDMSPEERNNSPFKPMMVKEGDNHVVYCKLCRTSNTTYKPSFITTLINTLTFYINKL